MRSKFNLDLVDLTRLSVLLQGIPNTGKTHLLADMLREERKNGPVRFLNVKGEDGWASAAHMGLGEIGETVSTPKDIQDFAAECAKGKVHAVGLDGCRPLFNHILVDLVQSDPKNAGQVRLPDAKLDGERSKAYWAQARFTMEQTIAMLKTSVNILVATSTSAQDVHEITGEKQIAPDIYGKMGSGLIGLFDFAGYIKSVPMGPGRVERRVSFQVRNDVQTRQRLANPIKEDIVLMDGFGSWVKIKSALVAGLAYKEGK